MSSSKTIKTTGTKFIKIYPSVEKKQFHFASLSTTTRKFLQNLKDYLLKALFVEPRSRVVVAVSGGVDSVSLLDCLFLLRSELSLELAVAHLNHKLRGEESDEDESFVQSLAEYYSLPLFLQRIDVMKYSKKYSLGIEETARIVRYDFLKRVAQSFAANFVATAHNLNDQAETVLLNIIRGTGIAGLRGIANRMELCKNVFLIRPFINLSRTDIEQYACERNLQWREDSSNLILKYTRNKIRHVLIPILEREFNPKIVYNLAKLSVIAQNNYKIVSSYINKFLEMILVVRNKSEVELNLENLTLFDDILFSDLFQHITNTYFNYTLSFAQIEELKNLVHAETGKYIMLSQRIFVYKNRQTLNFIARDDDFHKQVVKKIPKIGHAIWKSFFIEFEEIHKEDFRTTDDKFTEFFDYDRIEDEIIVRNWREGDKFSPLGMKGSKKLSDFFVDLKVPLYKKNEYPVFLSNNEIFWVGGLRISDKFKVTSKTTRVLKGRLIKIKSNE